MIVTQCNSNSSTNKSNHTIQNPLLFVTEPRTSDNSFPNLLRFFLTLKVRNNNLDSGLLDYWTLSIVRYSKHTKEHKVSATGSVSVLTWRGGKHSIESFKKSESQSRAPTEQVSPTPSPKVGNRSTFRNVVFLKIQEDGQSPKTKQSRVSYTMSQKKKTLESTNLDTQNYWHNSDSITLIFDLFPREVFMVISRKYIFSVYSTLFNDIMCSISHGYNIFKYNNNNNNNVTI
jgi:hypothetical protein